MFHFKRQLYRYDKTSVGDNAQHKTLHEGIHHACKPEHTLDVIAIGRSSVDLYGQQIGSRLEDIATFSKSVGGCPANIAIGTARLGLKSGLITRVGNEQMGRFIIEQCAREGVATEGIIIDQERLTALVLLAVEEEGVSPMIFYRPDCADMALDEDDVDEAFVKSSQLRAGFRHAFLHAQHRSRAAQGHPHLPRRMAARWCSTSTTARTSGALPAMTPGSSAT